MRPSRRAVLLALVLAFAVLQAFPVPFRQEHRLSEVYGPVWPSPEGRRLVVRSCAPCHIDSTEWDWAAHVAPFSWSVEYRKRKARVHLDFSDWGRAQMDAYSAADEVAAGRMPPPFFSLRHRGARLTRKQQEVLIQTLKQLADERLSYLRGRLPQLDQNREAAPLDADVGVKAEGDGDHEQDEPL